MKVKRTERGWGGHYICNSACLFRRNTLLEYGNIKVVISTVGNMYLKDIYTKKNELQEIGAFGRLYETMVFHSNNDKYNDIDTSREFYFESECALYVQDDIEANEMHENVVDEITKRLLKGEKLDE